MTLLVGNAQQRRALRDTQKATAVFEDAGNGSEHITSVFAVDHTVQASGVEHDVKRLVFQWL